MFVKSERGRESESIWVMMRVAVAAIRVGMVKERHKGATRD